MTSGSEDGHGTGRTTGSPASRLVRRLKAVAPAGSRVAALKGCHIGVIAAALVLGQPAVAQVLPAPNSTIGDSSGNGNPSVNFGAVSVAADTRRMANWVVGSHDNRGLPFVVIDKVNAAVFVFDGHGRLQGASRALIGLARGDDSVAGIGDRPLSSIRPEDRTTPAGRFVAALGHDIGNKDILWVDYDDAIALHRVVTSNPKERRTQRLASDQPAERRISYGCINVPAKFYDAIVIPAFTATDGVAYILPETRTIHEVFPAFPG